MPVVRSDEVLSRATTNFNSIKSGFEYIGIDTSEITSDSYGTKIRELKPQLDSIVELEEQVDELTEQNTTLNSQVSEDNTDFSDIYNAIITKGQSPVENDRSTYAPAILGISSTVSFTDLSYFFYENFRHPDDYWNLVNNKVTRMIAMIAKAMFTGGNTYIIDLTGIVTWDTSGLLMNNPFSIGGTGDITLNFVLGTNITTLKNLLCAGSFNQAGNTSNRINLILSGNGANIINMDAMFSGLYINTLDLSGIVNAKPTSLINTFNLSRFTGSVNLNVIDTSLVTSFKNCFSSMIQEFTELNISDWSFETVRDVSYMFQNNYADAIILPAGLDLVDIYQGSMFWGAKYITTIALDVTDSISQLSYAHDNMFRACSKLQNIVTTKQWVIMSNMEYIFYDCVKLTAAPSIQFNVIQSGKRSLDSAYRNCSLLTTIDISIVYNNSYAVTLNNAFYGCTALQHITGNLDMSYIVTPVNVFYGCTSLIDIETTGSFGGLNTEDTLTLDLSASAVFNISKLITDLAANESGKTRNIKLNATVYAGLTTETRELATTKNYTLISA